MATKTSVGSGKWSEAGTWDAGVPANNDAAVIASGHTVEFDVDQSGFADGIDGITITGTLSLTRSAGVYYLKVKAGKTIGGAGTFDCGTLASPIPFAAKHTITGGAGWYIKGNDGAGLTMTVYAAEPAIKTVRLTGAEAIGATVLEVDTDITGDIWADGDTIRIDNVNKAQNSEERVIAAGGRAAGAITITAGLTTAKIAGTLVHLITRNVKFIGVGAAGIVVQNVSNGKLTVAGGEFRTANYRIFRTCGALISGGTFSGGYHVAENSSLVITGGVFSGNTITFYFCAGINISGGTFSGQTDSINACAGASISGGTFSGGDKAITASQGTVISGGTFVGFYHVVTSSFGLTVLGGIYNQNNYFMTNSAGKVINVQLNNFLSSIMSTSHFTAFNVLFGSVENVNYTTLSKYIYSESIDHDQVAGAYKAWTRGGVTTSQASVLPTGYSKAYQTVLENASVEGYWQKEVTVEAGASVNITANLRKAASMTYLPRCIIFNKASADPFAGGAGLHTFTMTDSIDTWEADTYTYGNSTSEDITLVIRFQGMHAAATFYSALLVEQINVDLTSALAKLTAIQAKTDNLPTDPADESLLEAAISSITVDNAAIAAAVMASVVEGSLTLTQAQRLILAALAGKASGGGTTTVKFRDTADSKDRIVATVDSDGNRSTVVLDAA